MGVGQYLLCGVGPVVCALPLSLVAETLRLLPLQTLSGVPEWFAGITRLRGEGCPVIDLGSLLGIQQVGLRLVRVQLAQGYVALRVERVHGVVQLGDEERGDWIPLVSRATTETIASVGSWDERLLMVIDQVRLCESTRGVWKHLEG